MSQNEIDELRAEVARLTQRIDELSERAPSGAGVDEAASPECTDQVTARPEVAAAVSRRGWMKAAAAAAVGGTAVALSGSQQAAAANGDPILLGDTNTATSRTRSDYTGGSNGVGFLFQSGSAFEASAAGRPAALGGYTTTTNQPTGVYGYSNVTDGATGVDGVAGGTTNGIGVRGQASGDNGVGVEGRGAYGVVANGSTAAMVLRSTDLTPPNLLTGFQQPGSIYVREASDSGLATEVWYCVVGGEPASWQQIAGPGMGSPFRAIEPIRVYDSRSPQPDPGVIAGGDDRIVDVSTGREVGSGAPIGLVVPDTAVAIAYNLTVVNTVGTGYLYIAPSWTTGIGASSINWFGSGQIIANAGMVRIGSDVKVKVFAGGFGSTNFIIDITGYQEGPI